MAEERCPFTDDTQSEEEIHTERERTQDNGELNLAPNISQNVTPRTRRRRIRLATKNLSSSSLRRRRFKGGL